MGGGEQLQDRFGLHFSGMCWAFPKSTTVDCVPNKTDTFFYWYQASPELLTIPRIVFLHGQDDVPQWTRQNAPNKITEKQWSFLKPQVPQWGTHHSKFFLLVFPAGCRVVVMTANLCQLDLTVMSNAVWWQDFPKKTPAQLARHASSEFEEDLLLYLNRLGWRGGDELLADSTEKELVGPEAFRQFDFSGAGAKLIRSVPGRHKTNERTCWGHPALHRALEKQRFPKEFKGSPVLGQFSSMGSFSEKWLDDEFCVSLCGGVVKGTESTEGTGTASTGTASTTPSADKQNNFRSASSELLAQKSTDASKLGKGALHLIWPTKNEIRDSLAGYVSGGSIPGSAKNVGKTHVLPKLHKWSTSSGHETSTRDDHPFGRRRAVPHIKTFARYLAGDGDTGEDEDERTEDERTKETENGKGKDTAKDPTKGSSIGAGTKLAWVFLGSHNLSGAAWGKFELNNTQLNLLSYELGVLLTPNLVGKRVSTPFCVIAASALLAGQAVDLPGMTCLAGARPFDGGSEKSKEVEFRHASAVNTVGSSGTASGNTAFAPLPYHVPPPRYETDDKPWTFDETHAEPDWRGQTWDPRG